MKKILIKIRTSLKLIVLVGIATLLICGAVALLYKPVYEVSIDDEVVGYCREKTKLQTKINSYMENGEGSNENIAFVQVEKLPKYKLCLGKNDVKINEDEIYEKIKASGVTYYKYFAISEDDEEKVYVSNYENAEKILSDLKEKDSSNLENLEIIEKYETELKEFATEEDAVSSLYKEKVVVVTVAKTTRTSTTERQSSGSVATSSNISQSKVSLGITLIKPVSGTISSRFGVRSSIRSSVHTGLDIATSKGTPILAAASGTVTYSGYKGSYGNMVVISHGNGVQTYYAHCNSLYVSVGDKVAQGSKIAAVGSTGNSTGPHLHLEIRVNGVAYNPQNYLY